MKIIILVKKKQLKQIFGKLKAFQIGYFLK